MATQVIDKQDARYPALTRGNNQRWVGSPDKVYLPATAAEVSDTVKTLVTTRFAVRSGGHCYEDNVFGPDVKAVIDLGRLRTIEPTKVGSKQCIAVDAGLPLWDVYSTLHRAWGTTLPGGSCATVGAGGHIVAGGYGLLSRLYGITVDYLHGVDVVVGDGTIRKVTRDSGGTDKDLWWAHTGGGGGNFGIVTRYLLRDPAASDSAGPESVLPKAPALVLLHEVELTWQQVGPNGEKLARMLHRYDTWCRTTGQLTTDTGKTVGPRNLFALFRVFASGRPDDRAVLLTTQVAIPDTTADALTQARDVLAEFVGAITVVSAPQTKPAVVRASQPLPWLHATHQLGQGTWDRRGDYKSAYHQWLTGHQITTLVERFRAGGLGSAGARVALDTYGGKVNEATAGATAQPHRRSTIKMQYQTYWTDPDDDGPQVSWLRQTYEAIYAETGGVPYPPETPVPADAAPDDPRRATDGCFVAYLDADLPAHDAILPAGTKVGWPYLYYGPTTYAKLRAVKKVVDQAERFKHRQSVKPAV